MKNFTLFFACCLILFSISLIPLLPESFSQEEIKDKFQQAENLLKEKKFADLMTFSEEELLEYPNEMVWLYYQARAYEGLEDYKKAIEIYENILKNNDIVTNKILFHYAISLFEDEQFELALQYFNIFGEEDGHFLHSLEFKGLILMELGKYEEALAVYEILTSKEDPPSNHITNHAAVLSKLERYDEALEMIEKSLERDPDDPAALAVKGDIYFHSGNYANAEILYNQVLAITPEDVDVQNNKALALSKLERHEESLAIFDGILEKNQNQKTTLLNKGTVLYELKRYDEAIAAFERVLALEPENDDALNNIGGVYSDQEKYSEAIEYFDKALSVNPNDVGTLNNKALALGHLGQDDKAKEILEKILRLDPENQQANTNYKIALANIEHRKNVEFRLQIFTASVVSAIIALALLAWFVRKRYAEFSADSSPGTYVFILILVGIAILLLSVVYIDLSETISLWDEEQNDISNWAATVFSLGVGVLITLGLFIYTNVSNRRIGRAVDSVGQVTSRIEDQQTEIGGIVQQMNTVTGNIETQQQETAGLVRQVAEINTLHQTEKENRKKYFEKMIVTALGTTREKLTLIKERIGTEHGVINQAIIDEWNTLKIPAERFEMIIMMAGDSLNHEISDDIDQIRGTLKNSPSDDSAGLLSQIDELEKLILPILTDKLDAVREEVLKEHLAKIERLREKHLSEGSQSKNQDLIKAQLDLDERKYQRMYGK